jgi:hypothetical protein
MNCESARKELALFLYGELSFDEEERLEQHLEGCPECRAELERERRLHAAVRSQECEMDPELLQNCRRDLHFRLQGAARGEQPARHRWSWIRSRVLVPAGGLALVAMGFFGGRISTTSGGAPVVARIRYVQPDASGHVQIVLDETRQRVLTGRADEEPIRRLLLAAAKDPDDPGLRVETMDLLKNQSGSSEVRDALVAALKHDPNPGVRLKAMEGLKTSAGAPESRQALIDVLMADENPGVRTQAVDLLMQHQDESLVEPFQQLLLKEDNHYIRSRCQNALREMRASVETF